jgi:hypothetical protein
VHVGAGGAAFTAYVGGRLVADLWAGRAGSQPWRRETRGVLMSTTKGVVAVGTLIRTQITEPLGLELDLGTPAETQPLVAPLILPEGRAAIDTGQFPDPELWAQALFTVDGRSILDTAPEFFGNPAVIGIELGASNATATARAVATLFGALANGGEHHGVRLLSPETIATATAERRRGLDRITGGESRWALGFALRAFDAKAPWTWWGPHDAAFGANGYGGQIGFADPVSGVGVGFVRSEIDESNPLGPRLVRELYACLEGSPEIADGCP